MVRLKEFEKRINDRFALFQFHYGTIKRHKVVKVCCLLQSFQFHYGTIKREVGEICKTTCQYFNSTMVRLKDNFSISNFFSSSDFNSTMVRLKDRQRMTFQDILRNFNSTMVRLKAVNLHILMYLIV